MIDYPEKNICGNYRTTLLGRDATRRTDMPPKLSKNTQPVKPKASKGAQAKQPQGTPSRRAPTRDNAKDDMAEARKVESLFSDTCTVVLLRQI